MYVCILKAGLEEMYIFLGGEGDFLHNFGMFQSTDT